MMHTEYNQVEPIVLKIGGKRFVAGLYWQALTKPRAPLAEARRIGKREGKDVVSIRRAETVVQAGFMTRGTHNVKGLYSLATVLAQSISAHINSQSDATAASKHGATFLSAFRIDEDRYAMLAVKGGGILADSDMVGDLATVSANLHHFWSLINQQDCPVFAPPECKFAEAELSLDEMVANPKSHHQLKPLSRMPSNGELINIGLAMGVLLVAAVFAYDWHSAREAAKAEQAAAAAAELERLALESGKETAENALIRPWVKAPSVQQFVSVCEAAIRQIPLSMGGWLLVRASCGATGANAEYTRSDGLTIKQFQTATDAWNQEAHHSIRLDGNQAGITFPVTMTASGDEPLRAITVVREALLSHFQFKHIGITVVPIESAAVVLPGADPQAEQPRPDWETLTFNAISGQNPAIATSGMSGDGVRLTRLLVNRDASNLTWILEGEMYGK